MGSGRVQQIAKAAGIVLTLVAAITAGSAHGQRLLDLREVRPSQGLPGYQLELTLIGRGFEEPDAVRVRVGELPVLNVFVLSETTLRARLAIPEDTPPGPRSVDVEAVYGRRVVSVGLERVFVVMEPPSLRAVRPSQGFPGEQLEMTIVGRGFREGSAIRLSAEGLPVLDARVVSETTIRARIAIPGDASPGPRTIRVNVIYGRNREHTAELEEGFVVGEQPLLPSPVVAQIVPQRLLRGQRVEVTLRGRNFRRGASLEISGSGVFVQRVDVVSSQELRALVDVREDAVTGWRDVVVINTGNQRSEQPRSLQVVEEVPTDPPATTAVPVEPRTDTYWIDPDTTSSPNVSLWVWGSLSILLLGIGGFLGRTLTIRSRGRKVEARGTWIEVARKQWQLEATTELPDPVDACTWACTAQATTDLLKRWRVTKLKLTPSPRGPHSARRVKYLEGDILDPLTEAAHPQFILEDDAQICRHVAPVVDATVEQVMEWKNEGNTPALIQVDVVLARDVTCAFQLYHCEQTETGLEWVDHDLGWEGTLHQPGGKHLGVLRGPTAGEQDFEKRARRTLEMHLLQLVKGLQFKL